MSKQFKDYINYGVDYPGEEIVDDFKANVCYQYISTDFLNGYINYVKPLKAYMIGTLYDINECEWKDKVKALEKELNEIHTDLRGCKVDDISIIAESKKYYWWFYADRDVSDSCIMKIDKDRVEDINEFLKAFREVCLRNGGNVLYEIPVDKMTGWIEL